MSDKKIFLIMLVCIKNLSSISVVYNLRIAETTRRQAVKEDHHLKPTTIATTFVGQARETYDGFHQDSESVIATGIYTQEKWYVRSDFAVGHVRQKGHGLCFSQTETDDILLYGGYSHINKKTRFTLSGIFGIPTHNLDTQDFEGITFGTGHVGLGAQLDGSFLFADYDSHRHLIMGAARFVHFFPRNIHLNLNNFCKKFDFNIGNLADLLVVFHSNWRKHSLEIGYNPEFLFSASICPSLDDVAAQTNYIRSSFYASYSYGFLIHNHLPNAIIVGFSYSFDHRPKQFGLKNGYTAWVTWGVNF